VRSVAFRPDGRGMASGGDDYTWKSWNVGQLRSSGQVEHVFTEGHTDTVISISFSPDSRWIVTSSNDRTLRIWEATTGVWVCTLVGHTAGIWGADFSPAGQYLVTGGFDRRVLLWRYRGVDE
jgi:WD40 repeat protein